MKRRKFLQQAAAGTGALALSQGLNPSALGLTIDGTIVDDFTRADSLFHGAEWESLNPGCWKVENNALRRRLKNYGDRARLTGFPNHSETHGGGEWRRNTTPHFRLEFSGDAIGS